MRIKLPANIIALLESFLVLAETPNISRAANTVKVSRVTIQNRLKELERLCGFKLLELDSHNQYTLTERAESLVQEVTVWLRQGEDIFSLSDERVKGLLQSVPQHNGEGFYWQQHPVSALWEHNTPYLKSMLAAWVKAEGQFDSPALAHVCDHAFLARLRDNEFVIMGIGKDAAIMNWLGREWCLSSVGKPLSSTAISTKADKIVTYAYRQVILLGSPWYDHVSMEMPRLIKGTKERAYYRRLILPCKLPDGSPLIASVVELSDDLVIDGLEVSREHQLSRGS